MSLLGFLKPNGAKILLFLLLLVIAPFPYFYRPETSNQYEVRWIWGFPPIVGLIYDFLPLSLQELNKGILDISKVSTTFYWIPTYAVFIFLLSCIINLIIEKIKIRYQITTFRGILWRKLEKLETKPLDEFEQHEKIVKKEIRPEVKLEEIDEKKVKEMSNLIKEEEAFLTEQKKKLGKYLDEMNIQKLKSIGVDVRENKIFCSECKQWKTLPKDQLLKLIEKYGFDVIWEYKCPDCGDKK